MENFGEIINYIARTNLFNFAIFLTIIILLVKKINVSGKLEQMKGDVENSVEESKTAKTESENRLGSIEASMANIEVEIDEILSKSQENAKLVGEKILDDTQKTVVTIKENTEKSLENSRTILKNDLLKRASLASVEVAKKHIIEELEKNQDLHNKLIDESLETIGGLEV